MDSQGRKGGVVSKQRLYQLTAAHAPRAIAVLMEALEKGENYATKVGAAKTILAKCIPDLKAMEWKPGDTEGFIMKVEYVKQNPGLPSPSTTEDSGQQTSV